ncbi:MAG: hypothetical protein KDD70_17260 [Bdellovibrionales bacterium]|nr:hypothetical protein [Bdellovibrionales bacterium]
MKRFLATILFVLVTAFTPFVASASDTVRFDLGNGITVTVAISPNPGQGAVYICFPPVDGTGPQNSCVGPYELAPHEVAPLLELLEELTGQAG